MKLFILFALTCCFLFTGCDQGGKEASTQEAYEKKRIQHTLEDGKLDSVYLNYALGWSKIRVNQHTRSLIEKGVLDIDGNYIRSTITFNDNLTNTQKAIVGFDYYDGYMYKLIVLLDGYMDPNYNKGVAQLSLLEMLTKKYGYPTHVYSSEILECDKYFWLVDNVEIELRCNVEGVVLTYLDLPMAQQRQNEMEAEKEDGYTKTLEQF